AGYFFYKGAIPPGFFYSNETRAGISGEDKTCGSRPKQTKPFIFTPKKIVPPVSETLFFSFKIYLLRAGAGRN
ncbi:MAG: hypothetical protein D6714_04325, partial [Bacteroidetes bacterium]